MCSHDVVVRGHGLLTRWDVEWYTSTQLPEFIAQSTKSQDMKVFTIDFRHHYAIAIAFVFTFCGSVTSVVTNNFVDSVPVFTVKGSSISLAPKKVNEEASFVSFSLSPYTQIIRSCYDKDGVELGRLGDRTGYWGMGAMARDVISNYSTLTSHTSWTPIQGSATDFPIFWAQAKERAPYLDTRSTSTAQVNFSQQQDLYYSVDFEYEKIGIRSELACEPAQGIIMSLQTGICDHKTSTPRYYKPGTDGPYPETADAKAADPLTAAFMWNDIRSTMLGELGMDESSYQNIELDDITAQVSAYYPILFKGDERATVQLVPRATMALIIPSDEIMKKKKATVQTDSIMQSLVPVGNDGFTGFMMEAGACLDFKDTINFTVLAGYTIFKERSIKDYRLPNGKYQCVLYPFKQNVSKKRGGTWHMTASMYAEEFIPGMKCFLDYSWIVHRPDTVTLDDATKLPIFKEGLEVVSRLSEFRVGTGHLGLSYRMSKDLEAGVSMQVVLHGMQVYKPYTFMASLFLVF